MNRTTTQGFFALISIVLTGTVDVHNLAGSQVDSVAVGLSLPFSLQFLKGIMQDKNALKVRSRGIYTLYAVALLDLLAVSLFLPLISREIRDLGASPFMVGVVGSVYGAIQLFSSPLVGRESDRYGRKLVISVMLGACALAYTLQGSATTLGVLLVGRCMAGMFKHTQTLGKAILADLAPNEKSYVFGNVNAFGSMGYIIGPTIGGHLVAYENGFHNVCYLAAVIFVFNIILVSLLVPETSFKHKDGKIPTKEKTTDGNDFYSVLPPWLLEQTSP
ncbi:unnamed protein product [Allacma fusca]|uniref:Major facilitator superfamily (MFS) profile domain-containing protein n=1 Tax=Allacma fusca TaxID=39272 RepID=A0A8J2LJ91_9HEXA|nr:unnamed protein product [Allacma fusca]